MHGAVIRSAVAAAVMLVMLAATGCGFGASRPDNGSDQSHPDTDAPQSTSKSAPRLPKAAVPAADAGGICGKLSYKQIERKLDVTFNVAALHRSDHMVQSCTFRSTSASLPDLTLAFVPGKLDNKAFAERIKPSGSTEAAGLGTSAYTLIREGGAQPDATTGPVCEVGWFDSSGSFTLVLTNPAQTSTLQAQGRLSKLVELGKAVK